MLRIKARIAQARPLLHALLLFAPTLAMAGLVGRKPALCLAAILSVCIELAQFGFGYGFDWGDIGDLANDTAGIFAALWIHRKFQSRRRSV